ncbi:Ribonuclease P protein subunit p21 [Coemansia sp. RSA 2703]|nr:Ribonuclease P protein subunit p21 [Coemansia sp. RSA 2703]KAJ2378896.1 Ribonuclease P protein subunit p21 [Coemansia sp. RSA 2607]KAJ2395367.1 Ribonuclease P protein subunit p21 [Coemansia sp. RSA 2603]
MAKGSKAQKRANNGGTLPNRELYERMNFLYQSSQFYAQLAQVPASTEQSPHSSNSNTAQSSLLPLSRFYAKEMRTIARKSVLRISPHIKRELCKSCSTPLVPGVSCTKRVKGKKKARRLITTCNFCGSQKRLMANSDSETPHVLFIDRPEHKTIKY